MWLDVTGVNQWICCKKGKTERQLQARSSLTLKTQILHANTAAFIFSTSPLSTLLFALIKSTLNCRHLRVGEGPHPSHHFNIAIRCRIWKRKKGVNQSSKEKRVQVCHFPFYSTPGQIMGTYVGLGELLNWRIGTHKIPRHDYDQGTKGKMLFPNVNRTHFS